MQIEGPALQIEMRSVGQLVPYARNARTHSDEQVAQIAASIAEFGFTNPILIGEGGGRASDQAYFDQPMPAAVAA